MQLSSNFYNLHCYVSINFEQILKYHSACLFLWTCPKKIYDSSFIWHPTVSGDQRLVGDGNIKCPLAEFWNTSVGSQRDQYQTIQHYCGGCSVWIWLYFFSRLIICSASLELTFFTTTNLILTLLTMECSWGIVSFIFVICLKSLDIYELMTIFSFKASIFHNKSGFL